jgi:hypothetical protein
MNRTNKRNLTVIGKKASQNPLLNTNIITTPYEKVLSILVNIKQFISNIIKGESTLVKDIDWCIKIITSHSLYSYELKDKEKIKELSRDDNEFKELVDFVSEYNEKVIKMNRKYNYILSDKLLQKSSIKLNRRKIDRKSSYGEDHSNILDLMALVYKDDKKESEDNNNDSGNINKKDLNKSMKTKKNYIIDKHNILHDDVNKKHVKIDEDKNILFNTKDEIQSYNSKHVSKNQNHKHKPILLHKRQFFQNNLSEDSIEDHSSLKKILFDSEEESHRKTEVKHQVNSHLFNPSNQNYFNPKTSKNTSSDRLITYPKENSLFKSQNILLSQNYELAKLITTKNFDIFKLESLIGYNNVLPLVGRTILENLGLLDEGILCQDKLDNFLIALHNQYKPSTLYHNSMHGSDVTQTSYIFFTHSNAEKVAKTNVIDILSIIIAALGHDLGHPGLTNIFHMNDSTEIAIVYNDISILENFHASLLFKTLRKTENNIFEKLSTIDYKIIRKRMISEILATDMANHGKIVSVIKSKIVLNENNEFKLNLLSGNEQSKIEEQQYLLDFMMHLADLGHNTKLFDISLKWVALLSEEFWRQGDLEKKKNLPVSFLCDRDQINIPQSQKGFINGFVIPTFENLVTVFPSLKFTLDNANNNLKEWQKLLDAGRLTGWTPKKNKKNKIKNKFYDNLGYSDKYIIKENKDDDEQKNEIESEIKNKNIIKKKVSGKINGENNKSNNNKINSLVFKSKNSVFKNTKKAMKINKNQIKKAINNSYHNINKIMNQSMKEKIANSSREMKRANFISDKNTRKFKISIIDNISNLGDDDIQFKTDTNLYFFSYNSKSKNRKKYK